MDPISITGLGLGAISLALQLFSGCIQSYQLMVDIVNMPKQVEPHRIRMRLEQIRLLEWGDKVGLLEEVMKEPSVTLKLHRNVIIEILLQIQDLFKNCLKLDTKFGSSSAVLSSEIGGKIGPGNVRNANRGVILLEKALKVVGKSSELPKRVEWAMVKQDRFSKLVGQLIGYNDSMVSLLDRVTMTQVHQMQIQSNLMILQLSSQIEDLKQLTQAMQVRAEPRQGGPHVSSGWNGLLTSEDRHTRVKPAESLALLANFKADRMILESSASSEHVALLNRSDFTFKQSISTRQMAEFQRRRVWIEWKEVDEQYEDPDWKSMIELRVRQLVTLLALKDKPVEFRAPDCLGCFYDEEDDTPRYGLVYHMPKSQIAESTPITLLELIKTTKSPSLTQRFRLANELARSLMYLHSVNWLHKGIRSDNIIFFSAENATPDYSAPIISGFEYSRPDLPDEMTEKPQLIPEHAIYRHPISITHPASRSQKSWDIYSLGIVLIEIAFWRSIDSIPGINLQNQKKAISAIMKMKSFLLGADILERIGGRAGEKYQEVVRCCVNGGQDLGIDKGTIDETDPEIGATILMMFSQRVVSALDSLDV